MSEQESEITRRTRTSPNLSVTSSTRTPVPMPTLPESEINRPLIHGNTEVSAALININHFTRSFQILSPEFYRRKFIAVFQKGTISHVAHRSRPTGESVQCYGTPDKTSCSATHHLTLSLQRRKQNQRVAIGNRQNQ